MTLPIVFLTVFWLCLLLAACRDWSRKEALRRARADRHGLGPIRYPSTSAPRFTRDPSPIPRSKRKQTAA